jgi:hypothetical protein
METELAISTGFARAEFKDKICVLIFYVYFSYVIRIIG